MQILGETTSDINKCLLVTAQNSKLLFLLVYRCLTRRIGFVHALFGWRLVFSYPIQTNDQLHVDTETSR